MSTDPEPDIDQAPDLINTDPTREDGAQDVDQEIGYEEADSTDDDDTADPAVYQVA